MSVLRTAQFGRNTVKVDIWSSPTYI